MTVWIELSEHHLHFVPLDLPAPEQRSALRVLLEAYTGPLLIPADQPFLHDKVLPMLRSAAGLGVAELPAGSRYLFAVDPRQANVTLLSYQPCERSEAWRAPDGPAGDTGNDAAPPLARQPQALSVVFDDQGIHVRGTCPDWPQDVQEALTQAALLCFARHAEQPAEELEFYQTQLATPEFLVRWLRVPHWEAGTQEGPQQASSRARLHAAFESDEAQEDYALAAHFRAVLALPDDATQPWRFYLQEQALSVRLCGEWWRWDFQAGFVTTPPPADTPSPLLLCGPDMGHPCPVDAALSGFTRQRLGLGLGLGLAAR